MIMFTIIYVIASFILAMISGGYIGFYQDKRGLNEEQTQEASECSRKRIEALLLAFAEKLPSQILRLIVGVISSPAITIVYTIICVQEINRIAEEEVEG